MNQIKIELKNISKKYKSPPPQGTEIFRNLDMTIYEGEFLCIVGPNGCGKSTLFNIISGLEAINSGEVNISKSSKKNNSIGYMMQRDLLLPWRTAYQNIMLGLEIQGKINHNNENIINNLIQELKLERQANSYPSTLSGGECRKIALIRTLVTDPDILLFDEPLSTIDYDARLDIERALYSLVKKQNKTILFVTHDIDQAIAMGDRIIIFNQIPKGIKSEHIIDLEITDRDPIKARESTKYVEYFSQVWRDFPK